MNWLKSTLSALLLVTAPLGVEADIMRAAHRAASDFSSAWSGGPQSQNAPFWQFSISGPGSPNAKILRTDLSSSNSAPQEWGAAPLADQHVQPAFAHNRVITAVETKSGWRVVSADANSNAPQWLDMGESPVGQVDTLFINEHDELTIVGRNPGSNNPETWQGSFSGGGAGLSWQKQDAIASNRGAGKSVMGEFDLGDGGRLLSLTWNPKQSGAQLQYRTSPAAGEPYSAWSQPVQSDSTQLNKRGRFLQYRLTRSDGALMHRDKFPPIEVAYSNGESDIGADKNQYDKNAGGASASASGLNVDASTDLDGMSGTDHNADAGASGNSVSSPSGGSPSGGGASSSKASKASPSLQSNTPNPTQRANNERQPSSQNQAPSPKGEKNNSQQQTPNENPNANPDKQDGNSENNSQPHAEKKQSDVERDNNAPRDEDEDEDEKNNNENGDENPEDENAAPSDEQQSEGVDSKPSAGASGGGAGNGPAAATGSGNASAKRGRQNQDRGDGGNSSGAAEQSPTGHNSSPANANGKPEDEGDFTPADDEDEPEDAPAPAPPPTMVPFANPGSIPLSSLFGASMASSQKNKPPKMDDAQGGGDETTPPDGDDGAPNEGDKPLQDSGAANGGGEEGNTDAGSPLGDMPQEEGPSKRFGAVRPTFGGSGGGGGSSSGSNMASSGRAARATGEIEYASAPAFTSMKSQAEHSQATNGSGWLWLVLVAALAAWLAYRIKNERSRKREMDELQAQQAPSSVPQKLIDETYSRQGAWEQVTHYIPEVLAVAVKNGTRYAVMNSGDIWKESEQSNSSQSAPLKFVGRASGEWKNAHLSLSDNALFFVGEDASGQIEGRIFSLRQINAKPRTITAPNGLKNVQRAWFHKSRLWLQGDVNGEPAVFSAMADAAGAGGWVQETPAKFDAADSVCVSSGASIFFAGSPKQDREHLWLYTGGNRASGRLEWKPAAKTAYQGGEVFLFGDAKKCFMVEFDSHSPHLWFHVFGRGDQGEFLGRFTKELDMPAAAQVFESHVANGHLVLAGRDSETRRVVHLQAKVKTLLGMNQN